MKDHAYSFLYLNKADIICIDGNSSQLYIDAVSRAFMLHAEDHFVQPLKPYLRWSDDGKHIADRIIAMPAYLGGEEPIAGLKWVGSKHDNPTVRGIERASALIILNDPQTNYPLAIMEGSRISGMRTAAVTALAARYLALPNFKQLTCIGCGPIGRMQIFTLLEYFPSISTVYLFDQEPTASDSLAKSLRNQTPSIDCIVTENARDAVSQGEVVITCTTADKPYILYEWLRKGTFLCNISLMDLSPEIFLKAHKVVVDDWDQCCREGKVIHQLVESGHFSFEQLYAELSEIISGKKSGRISEEETILLNPMGIAIEDIACAQAIYKIAQERYIGSWLSLY